MIALGTVVGGSFFLGSAVAIRAAGPAVIISFLIGGILVYFILTALSEMTVADPAPGSFRAHTEKNFGPWLGFVVGWVYWTGLVLGMSSEATAVSILLRALWLPQVPLGLIAAFIVVVVTLLNLFGSQLFSRLETSLASVKLLALIGFVIVSLALIIGVYPGKPAVGIDVLQREELMPAGLAGIAGSMLIVMISYAGFEVVGLAAPENRNPQETVPRAIIMTVVSLIALYLVVILVLLPLIPTDRLTPDMSPLVMALSAQNLPFAASLFNIMLITAILSTMLAAAYSLGRMLYSLALEGHAPSWFKEKAEGNVPKRGIIFSGAAMLLGVSLSYVLPKQIYLFLVSSGGFSLLFSYIIIMVTHYRFRRLYGCPPSGRCQLPGFPYTSFAAILMLTAVVISMPLIPGQGSGLWAGLILTAFYTLIYPLTRRTPAEDKNAEDKKAPFFNALDFSRKVLGFEAGEEWKREKREKNKRKK